MRTLLQIDEIPESGVAIMVEGPLTRLFFDFTDPELPEEMEESKPAGIKACENVDVNGRTYGEIVSAIIDDRYDASANQAIIANYQLAKDPDSPISEEKRAEYLQEYDDFQSWRSHAKDIASVVTAQMAQ